MYLKGTTFGLVSSFKNATIVSNCVAIPINLKCTHTIQIYIRVGINQQMITLKIEICITHANIQIIYGWTSNVVLITHHYCFPFLWRRPITNSQVLQFTIIIMNRNKEHVWSCLDNATKCKSLHKSIYIYIYSPCTEDLILFQCNLGTSSSSFHNPSHEAQALKLRHERSKTWLTVCAKSDSILPKK